MKKTLKFTLISFLSIVLVFFLGLKWVMNWSPQARKARENVENSEKLKIGMTKNELLTIMGKPDYSSSSIVENETHIYYYYQPPFAASSGIDIEIRKDTLFTIGYYEGT